MARPGAALLLVLLSAAGGLSARSPQEAALAAAEPHAADAGAEVLAAQGNAVDAAVAVGFALAVTWPLAGNLGGGGFLLYRDPQGRAFFLDFRETAPAAAHPGLYLRPDGSLEPEASRRGWKAAGVPGSVPGLLEAHRRWGRLPRQAVLAPAIRLAEQGFQLSGYEGRRLAAAAADLRRDPLARRIFLHADGSALVPGDLVVQPELAATLRRIASAGSAAFRSGPVVEGLLAACREGGGVLSAADFRDYRPVLRPVHHFTWRGREVLAAPPPSSGGIFMNQVLGCLEGRHLGGWEHPETVLLIGEAMARAFADRNRWLGDPRGFDFDPSSLVAPDLLRQRRRALSAYRFTPPRGLRAAAPAAGGDTTHFSVADAAGGTVAVTTTLNSAYGARVMAPGGFFLNNEMDDFATGAGRPNQYGLVQGRYNTVLAGRRPLSSMSPVIVAGADGAEAVLGSPGGAAIPTSVVQVLLNRYRFGMGPAQAVRAPRFHRQDRPAAIQAEPGRLDAAAVAWLRSRGQPVRIRPVLGNVNALFRRGGRWVPVADARRGGAARSVQAAAAGSEP